MADPRLESLELGHGLAAGLVVHPRDGLKPLREGGTKIADQFVHLAAILGREVALDIDLPDRFAERSVEKGDSALPAVALLLLAAQGPAVEIELGLVEGAGQILRVAPDEMEGHVILPRVERHLVEQLADAADRARRGRDDRLDIAEAAALQIIDPVELRRQLGQLGTV